MSDKLSMVGNVALVTGGAKGMGAAHSQLLAERGCAVIIADTDPAGETLADDLRATGSNAGFVHLDVSNEQDWIAAVSGAMRSYGKVDVLVNNAGIVMRKPLAQSTVEDFDAVFNVNIKGVFLGCKHILAAMKAAGGGSIINIASASGLKTLMPELCIYSASKGAVRMFSKALAWEYTPHNIRVNSIYPGLIETARNSQAVNDPATRKIMLDNTMLDRSGNCGEVVEVVAFLASDASSYMAGAELAVDGGWTAN